MKCPHCQKPTFTLDTRTTKEYVRRRRECFNGHRFTTQETVMAESRQARAQKGAV